MESEGGFLILLMGRVKPLTKRSTKSHIISESKSVESIIQLTSCMVIGGMESSFRPTADYQMSQGTVECHILLFMPKMPFPDFPDLSFSLGDRQHSYSRTMVKPFFRRSD